MPYLIQSIFYRDNKAIKRNINYEDKKENYSHHCEVFYTEVLAIVSTNLDCEHKTFSHNGTELSCDLYAA